MKIKKQKENLLALQWALPYLLHIKGWSCAFVSLSSLLWLVTNNFNQIQLSTYIIFLLISRARSTFPLILLLSNLRKLWLRLTEWASVKWMNALTKIGEVEEYWPLKQWVAKFAAYMTQTRQQQRRLGVVYEIYGSGKKKNDFLPTWS